MTRGARTPRRRLPARGTRKAAASLFQHGDGPAKCGLAALEPPREAAELDLLVQHLVDLPAEILDVDDVVREQQRVHDLVVGLWKNLVKAPSQLLLGLFSFVRADAPDDRVHRMVRAA